MWCLISVLEVFIFWPISKDGTLRNGHNNLFICHIIIIYYITLLLSSYCNMLLKIFLLLAELTVCINYFNAHMISLFKNIYKFPIPTGYCLNKVYQTTRISNSKKGTYKDWISHGSRVVSKIPGLLLVNKVRWKGYI